MRALQADGTVFGYAPGAAPDAFTALKLGTADPGSDGKNPVAPQTMEGEVVKLTTAP